MGPEAFRKLLLKNLNAKTFFFFLHANPVRFLGGKIGLRGGKKEKACFWQVLYLSNFRNMLSVNILPYLSSPFPCSTLMSLPLSISANQYTGSPLNADYIIGWDKVFFSAVTNLYAFNFFFL